MRKATLTLQFEQEKLRALRFYMSKKESNPEAELDEYLVKLYEKYVPAQTREYIESMPEPEDKPRSRSVRPTRPATTEGQDGNGYEEHYGN